jgi:hypothetical protein
MENILDTKIIKKMDTKKIFCSLSKPMGLFPKDGKSTPGLLLMKFAEKLAHL